MSQFSTYPPTLNEGTLRVAAFSGFAPFAWRDGRVARGRDIAFLNRYAAEHGLRLVVDFHDFARLWELPAQHAADIAASGISLRSPTPYGQSADVAWTRPYGAVRRTLLIRAEDAGRRRGMDDLQRIAVVRHSAAQAHAEETLPRWAALTFTPTLEHGIEDLLLGQIDAVGTGSVSAEYHARRHPGLAVVDVHGNRAPEWISFAARPALVDSLNAFITRRAVNY